jgi:hypothetical protein
VAESRHFRRANVPISAQDTIAFAIAAALAANLLVEPAMAQPAKRNSPAAAQDDKSNLLDAVFSEIERQRIAEHNRAQNGRTAARPGLAGKSVPPGVQSNLDRGGRLPPGIANQLLPADLERRLPVRPGHERVIYGRDVYLVDRITGQILDVLRDVLMG